MTGEGIFVLLSLGAIVAWICWQLIGPKAQREQKEAVDDFFNFIEEKAGKKKEAAPGDVEKILRSHARFEHTHILGAPGAGKTELLKWLIKQDIETNAAVIVIEPKGKLIRSLAKLTAIDSDRLVLIEPDENLALNLFDLNASLIIYVFESLLESEPTPKQKAFLSIALKQVKNLGQFRAFLKQKHEKTYSETAEQLQWRLDLLLSNPLIEKMFSHPETQINVGDVMAAGKILFINTSIKKLDELGSSFFGRFFVALIAHATQQRDLDRNLRAVYVYLDEASTYASDYVESLLDRAREARVGLTLAHQHLKQLTDVSTKLEASIHNTAIKFVGRCNDSDARKMAAEMGLDPMYLQRQAPLHFVVYSGGKSYYHTVQLGYVENLPQRTEREMTQLIARNRERVTSSRLAPAYPNPFKEKEKSTEDPGTGTSME